MATAHSMDNQDEGAILALFSFANSRARAEMGTIFGGPNQSMTGRVLLCWTP